MLLDNSAAGLFPIAPTPFHPDGTIDKRSIDTLILNQGIGDIYRMYAQSQRDRQERTGRAERVRAVAVFVGRHDCLVGNRLTCGR